jgi:hypothetical protein
MTEETFFVIAFKTTREEAMDIKRSILINYPQVHVLMSSGNTLEEALDKNKSNPVAQKGY